LKRLLPPLALLLLPAAFSAAPAQSRAAGTATAPAVEDTAPAGPRAKPAINVGGPVERPDVRLGDRWTYRVTNLLNKTTRSSTLETTAVTASRIETRRTAGDGTTADQGVVEEWDRDWNLLQAAGVQFKPSYPTFRFPLEKDKSWSGSVSWTGSGVTTQHDLKLRVAGWERVTVPAGSFDAIRVNVRGYIHTTTGSGFGQGTIKDTMWYAPAIRQIVKHEIDQQIFRSSFIRNERWELTHYKAE